MANVNEVPGERKVLPYWCFYDGDEAKATAGFSNEEFGAYIRLKSACWTRGSIPSDVARLAKLTGTTATRMYVVWATIGSQFRRHPVLPDDLYHPGQERHYRDQLAAWNQRRQASKEAARRRTEGPPKDPPNGDRSVTERRPFGDRSVTESQSQSEPEVCRTDPNTTPPPIGAGAPVAGGTVDLAVRLVVAINQGLAERDGHAPIHPVLPQHPGTLALVELVTDQGMPMAWVEPRLKALAIACETTPRSAKYFLAALTRLWQEDGARAALDTAPAIGRPEDRLTAWRRSEEARIDREGQPHERDALARMRKAGTALTPAPEVDHG